MADVFTKAKRSQVMSCIRGRGNKGTELVLVRIFRANRITGWRRHLSLSLKVPGSRLTVRSSRDASPRPPKESGVGKKSYVRPDFVFPILRLAVFVDGCFWHGCPLHATQPKNNAAFWGKKLAANHARDQLVTRMLRKKGWRVLRLWEHDLSVKNQAKLLRRVEKALAAGSSVHI